MNVRFQAPLVGKKDAHNRTEAIANGTITGTNVPAVVQKLFLAATPTATPTSVAQCTAAAAKRLGLRNGQAAASQNILPNALGLILDGFTSSDLKAVIAGASPATNGYNNVNPALPPSKSVYKIKGNAPYSIPEPLLRAAIYVPPGFQHGKHGKQPVLMSPGTGATGGVNFESNIGKLLSRESFADPVYLNIPGELLHDIQINAEYVAYAIDYLATLTSQSIAIITWSQGSLDAQWAYKYWPSTRKHITDHIAVSPDWHGTILAYILCPGFGVGNGLACVPSIIQQDYSSNLVKRLRENGGSSAFVDVTIIYSLTDEIVQPQSGTAASGFLPTSGSAQTSNTFLQGACAGQPAGGLYSHEGVLYNPVTYALVVDALTHAGPGQFSRVQSACADVVAPGLSLEDVIETEALIPLAVYNIFSYLPRALSEPPLMSYATH